MKKKTILALISVVILVFVVTPFMGKLAKAQSTVTIQAWDNSRYAPGEWVSVDIWMDGTKTQYQTPHTFTVTGTHSFAVPITNGFGTRFSTWDSGINPISLTIWRSEGTYTARYNATPYDVTIRACDPLGWTSVDISMDGVSTGFNTPHTFTGLRGLHVFNVPNGEGLASYSFDTWSGYEYGRVSLSVCSAGTYTAQYGGALVPYSATIWAWDDIHGWQKEPIYKNGAFSGYYTPHTFTDLKEPCIFGVPPVNGNGTSFKNWTTGQTTPTITVTLEGTYTARYYHYEVTIWSWDYAEGWKPVLVTMDGAETFATAHTFTGLSGTHTFTVTTTNSYGHPFSDWDTGGGNNWTSSTLTLSSGGTYTARYRAGYSVTIWAWCDSESYPWINNVPVAADGAWMTGVNTPRTFSDLTPGTHTFTVLATHTPDHEFYRWDTDTGSSVTGSISITTSSAGVFTARYHSAPLRVSVSPTSVTMNVGQSQNFYQTPSGGSGSYSYCQWYVNGVEQSGVIGSLFVYTPTSTGSYSITVTITDSLGVTSPPSSPATVTVTAATPPTGSIVINGGNTYTNSELVTLSLTYQAYGTTVSQVRYCNDGASWAAWEAPASTKLWSVISGDGPKTVYYQIKDAGDLVSTTYSDSIYLDTTPPTGSMTVNNNATYTNSASVTLNYTLDASTMYCRGSNDGSSWPNWETINFLPHSWSLTTGDGTKTVYMQIKDSAGWITTLSDTIILDTTPPTGTITINSGAASTSSTSVTLELTYADALSGVSQVRYSNDGLSWTAWEAPATSKPWTLTPGEGTKTVYYQIKDNAGVVSSVYSGSIALYPPADFTPPIDCSILINDGAASTISTSVTLTLSAADAESGVAQMRFSNDLSSWSAWEAYATSKNWNLLPGDGAKTVYVLFKNGIGLDSPAYSDTITLQAPSDITPPSGSITINGGAATTNSASVVLTLSATDPESGVAQMRFSNNGTEWSTWETYTTSKPWTLTSGDGTKTVYAQFKNGAGLTSTTYTDTIALQTAGPGWSTQTVDSAGDVGTYASLALDSNGYPCISYHDDTNGVLKYAKWTGSAWSMQVVDSAGHVGEYSSLALDTNGNPCISYYDATNGYLKYAKLTGSAWNKQTVDSAGYVGQWTSLALDSTGNPRISYFDVANADLKFAKWTGTAWDTQTVDSGGVYKFSSLALDLSGYPCISYSALGSLKFARWTGSEWNIQNVSKTLGGPPLCSSLALDSSGNPRISYLVVDTDGASVRFAKWTSSTWSIQTVPESYGGAGWDGDRISLALDSNGNPCTSYSVGVLKFARWTGSEWNIQAVDLSGGSLPSLALDSSGHPHVSYWDHNNHDLRYAYGQSAAPTDTTLPTGSITINSGAATTNSAFVVLTLSATDPESGLVQMHFSNDGSSWSDWEAYATSKSWTLTPGDGTKTVYVQFKNGAGLESTSYSDSINLQSSSSDTTPPTGSIAINGGAVTTSAVAVTLTLSATDNSGVVAQMRFANIGESWTAWEQYASTKAWTLTPGTGTKTVLAQFKDGSGIESAPYGDTIQYDPSFEEKTFNVTVGASVYSVNTRSNSSVSDFSFNQVLKRIRFTTNGTTGTACICNMTIPATLMSGDFSLFMDDAQLSTNTGYSQTYNGTHYTFSISHAVGVHSVEIFATNVVPEYPIAAAFVLLMMLASGLASKFGKRIKPSA